MPGYNVEEEIELLAGHIKRLGRQEAEGYQVTFKVKNLNKFLPKTQTHATIQSNKSF